LFISYLRCVTVKVTVSILSRQPESPLEPGVRITINRKFAESVLFVPFTTIVMWFSQVKEKSLEKT